MNRTAVSARPGEPISWNRWLGARRDELALPGSGSVLFGVGVF